MQGIAARVYHAIKRAVHETSSRDYFRSAALYPPYLRDGNAAEICRFHALQYCTGKGIDVGAGAWPLPGARAIDRTNDEDALSIKESPASLDFVFSSHCLEHLEHWQQVLRYWESLLKHGGILYLYLPHPACTMWQVGINPYHVWSPDPATVRDTLIARNFTILEISWFPDAYMSFFVVARKG